LLTNLAGNLATAEALPLLEQALTVAQDITNKVMELRVRLGLGALHQQSGNHAQALEQTKEALQIAQEKGVVVQEGHAWNQLGGIYLSLSDTVQAMDAHRRALAIGERTQAPQVVWQALAGLAEVFRKQGNVEQAAQHYRQAIETIEGVRSRIGIAEDRASFFADKIEIYKKLLGLLVELQGTGKSEQPAAEAFRYAERALARAFFDLLAEAKVDVEQNAAADLLKQKQELQQRISLLTIQLIKERSQETGKQDKAKIGELEKGLGQADAELGYWLRELRRRNPRYAALKYPEQITLAKAQRMLDDKTILLSYSLAEPESFLFAVSRNDFQVKRLPSESTLGEGVQKLLSAITDKNHVERAITHNDEWLAWLTMQLSGLGLTVTPSVGNFILIHFPETKGKTAKDADALLTARGCVLRAVAAYHLPNALRMSIGTEEANKRVVATLAEMMGKT